MKFQITANLALIVTINGYLWEDTSLPGGCTIAAKDAARRYHADLKACPGFGDSFLGSSSDRWGNITDYSVEEDEAGLYVAKSGFGYKVGLSQAEAARVFNWPGFNFHRRELLYITDDAKRAYANKAHGAAVHFVDDTTDDIAGCVRPRKEETEEEYVNRVAKVAIDRELTNYCTPQFFDGKEERALL